MVIKTTVLLLKRICKTMVFGVKSAPAVGDKSTIINMMINNWLTFPFVEMKWLDSDVQT